MLFLVRISVLLAIPAFALLLPSRPSQAADISAPALHIKAIKAGPVGNLGARWPTDPVLCDIIYDGDVLPGDKEKLEEAFKSLTSTADALKHGFQAILPFLCLRSPGGSVQEGLRIARFVREAGIATVVEDGQMCASMCAVIFLAGTSRMAWLGSAEDRIEFPRRFLHPRGRLLYHSPYIPVTQKTDTEWMSYLTAPAGGGVGQRIYDLYRDGQSDAQSIIETFRGYSQASYRLGQPWVRQSLLLEKMANDSREWVCVDTVDAVGRWDIEVFGYKPPTAPASDQIFNMCYGVYHWRQDLSALTGYLPPASVNVATPAPDRRVLPLRRVYYNSLEMRCVVEGWPKRADELDEMASLLVHFQTNKGERVSESLSIAPFAFAPPPTRLHDLPGVRPSSTATPPGSGRDAGKFPEARAYPNARMQGCSYRALPQTTPEQCASACASDGWCQGYSYDKLTRTCELKHMLQALRFDPIWESGVPVGVPGAESSLRAIVLEEHPHGRRAGASADSYQLSVLDGQQLAPDETGTNAEACKTSCANDWSCAAATYQESGRTCRRFSIVTGSKLLTLQIGAGNWGTSWVKRQ